MTSEADDSQANAAAYNGYIAIVIVTVFTALGFFIALYWTNDVGTVKEGFWIGMGFAVVFLLSAVANELKLLRSDN